MKTLPTNHAVVAAFVNQSLPEARNPRDSVWFKQDTLYSYNSELAIITPDRTLFINSKLMGYSNTTTAHISSLRKIAQDLQIFAVPLDLTPAQTLNWYWEQVETSITKYLRARNYKWYHKECITKILGIVEQYVDYMQIDKTSNAYLYKHDITKQLFKHKIL